MLRFFRTIRQRLLTENRVNKYLLYAFGEIVLVMVGILLALQVNNWNEERKQRQVERKYFVNLRNDMQADLERLDFMMDMASAKVKAAQKMKQKANADSIGSLYDFSGDMLTLIFVDEFRPSDNTYEEMKSSGNFSTLRNDDLKLKLMNLKKTYVGIDDSQKHMRNDYDMFLEDFEKYIDWGKYYDLSNSNIPALDLKYDSVYIEGHAALMEQEVHALFRNKVFLNNIFLLQINYTYEIDVLKSTQSQVLEIVDLLTLELEKTE